MIKKLATPIRIYKMVHATGKSHPGGAKGGLFIVSNAPMASLVKKAESAPTINGIATQMMSVNTVLEFHTMWLSLVSIQVPPSKLLIFSVS